ncbi:hypothetical protein [Desulfovibrio legallii]|jgi:hypothetical protein|nr:hypothetical protein [Desulfovibrio legallii]
MVTMVLFYDGDRIVLEGSWEDVLARLRAFCPSGLLVELFSRSKAQ